jgi:hypothetical protein
MIRQNIAGRIENPAMATEKSLPEDRPAETLVVSTSGAGFEATAKVNGETSVPAVPPLGWFGPGQNGDQIPGHPMVPAVATKGIDDAPVIDAGTNDSTDPPDEADEALDDVIEVIECELE